MNEKERRSFLGCKSENCTFLEFPLICLFCLLVYVLAGVCFCVYTLYITDSPTVNCSRGKSLNRL